MSKITLNTIGTLVDTTTAQTALNDNFQTIQTAFDDTLSRDGTQPNVMGATLDMNSNRIINLPAPGGVNDPVRLQDVTGSPTLNLSITLAGDVTSPTGNGTLTTTIAAGAVTGSKIASNTVTSANIANGTVANIDLATAANNTIKSNVSGGVASPSDNTVSAVLDSVSSTQGTILYRGSSTWSALSPGTSGQVLSTNGVGANPSWITGGGSGGGSSLTPEQFGAVGNGTADDTTAMQNFFTACANGSGVLTPGKTYIMSGPALLQSNTKITGYGAIIKAPATGPTTSAQLHLTDAGGGAAPGPNNVTLLGLTINGNATARRAGGAFSGVGQYGGIYVYSCNNTILRDCFTTDCEGDGFAIGGGFSGTSVVSNGFVFDNCSTTIASRNGYSVIGAIIGSFINCSAENISYGAAHGNISSGWDFEPDNAGSTNAAINCISCQAVSCTNWGFAANNANGTNNNINWLSCYTQSNGVGYYSSSAGSGVRVIGCRVLGNTANFNNLSESLPSFP